MKLTEPRPTDEPPTDVCAWCLDSGWLERSRACACQRGGSCDPRCDDGWIYIHTRCDHGRGD